MTDQEAFARLSGQTYKAEHSPSCPKPFLVRLIRPGMGQVGTPQDIRGYGMSFGEAAEDALRQQKSATRIRPAEIPGLNSSWLDQK